MDVLPTPLPSFYQLTGTEYYWRPPTSSGIPRNSVEILRLHREVLPSVDSLLKFYQECATRVLRENRKPPANGEVTCIDDVIALLSPTSIEQLARGGGSLTPFLRDGIPYVSPELLNRDIHAVAALYGTVPTMAIERAKRIISGRRTDAVVTLQDALTRNPFGQYFGFGARWVCHVRTDAEWSPYLPVDVINGRQFGRPLLEPTTTALVTEAKDEIANLLTEPLTHLQRTKAGGRLADMTPLSRQTHAREVLKALVTQETGITFSPPELKLEDGGSRPYSL